MTMLKDLSLAQLDTTLAPWRELPRARPAAGWLRAIRNTLGMTTRQLAQLAGVTQTAVIDIEGAEARGDITLATLQRYATALDCELLYALVPRQTLQQRVEARAEALARAQVARVSHSMSLEAQSTSDEHREREAAELRRKLLEGRRSRLWK